MSQNDVLYRPTPGQQKVGEGPGTKDERETDAQVCRLLRTKLAFSAMVTGDGEPVHWQRGEGSTATYWCLLTMECGGPDDGLAHAEECRRGRGCYRE